jgi:hypothetical protein
MPAKKKKHKVVEVSWRDPAIDEGWIDAVHHPHDKELPIFKSYGILISQTKKQIVIAGGYAGSDGAYCDRSTYPAGCVEEVRVLEEVKL